MPPRDPKRLTMREQLFIRAYLGAARGNGAKAARLAGYSPATADRAAYVVLRRPRVRVAVDQALRAEAAKAGVNKDSLVGHVVKVMLESKPFERLKAIELLARLLGYFAPTRSIRETIPHQEGSSYEQLEATLQEHAADLTPEQRETIVRATERDIAAAQRCLAILHTPRQIS